MHPRGGRIIVIRRGTARLALITALICLAIAANAVPYFYGNSYSDQVLVHQAAPRWQLVGLAALVATAAVSGVFGKMALTANGPTLMILVFSLYLGFNALLSDFPETAAFYSMIFVVVAISISFVDLDAGQWQGVLFKASVVSAAMMIMFVSIKAQQGGRFYGAVHPNFVGGWVLVLTILTYAWKPLWKWLAVALLVALAVNVDSRFSVLAVLIFIASSEALERIKSPKRLILFALIGLAAMGIAGTYLVDLFASTGARSIEGGIAGRFYRWDLSFSRIAEAPFFGYGFRSAREQIIGAHSGFLTLVEELGLIGATALIMLVLARGRELFRVISHSTDRAERKVATMFLAALCANVAPLTFQPNYLNFGDPLGVFILLALFVRIPAAGREPKMARSGVPHGSVPGRAVRAWGKSTL